jgi:peptidoglycan hydrolase-like protein with peptidoglycan-binding domain
VLDGTEAQTDLLEPGADGAARQLPPPADSPRRRRLRLAALAGVLAVVAAVVAIVVATSGSSPRRAGGTGIPPGDTTATVTRRTLTESSTVDGTLGYGSKLEVFDRLAGTFTWLPAVGARIGRGGTLYRINNTPVALMYGSLPAYRTLKQGISDGPDVTQLNENLIDLGYDPERAIGDVEAFGAATAAAVKRWQKAEGLPQTGEVELGRIVFSPGERRVTEVHVSLGQDPPGAEASDATPEEEAHEHEQPSGSDQKEPAAEKPAAEKPAAKKPAAKKPAAKKPAAKKPAPEGGKGKTPTHEGSKHEQPPAKEASSDPSKKGASKEPSAKGAESPSGGGELALTLTSTQQQVQVALKAEQQQLARVGEHVPVMLPGGGSVGGRITSVGTVATQPKSGNGEKGGADEGNESPTIPVTVTLDHAVAHLDEAPVSVELVESVRHGVLTVPATALTATGGGGYAVETLSSGRRRTLAVTPGMFAGGYVQVEGAGLREGLKVIVSQ